MKWSAAMALAVLSTLCALPVRAQNADAPDPGFSAKALKDACDPPATLDQNAKDAAGRICQAYLRGVADGMFMQGALEQSGAPLCLPKDGPVSPAEAKSEFLDYLAGHPQAADRSAGVAVAFAIVAAHACE